MLNFRKAELKDRAEINGILSYGPRLSMEYNFTLLFMWQSQYNIEFAIEDNILFIRSGSNKKAYLFPCGRGDIKKAVDKIIELCPDGAMFYSLNIAQKDFL